MTVVPSTLKTTLPGWVTSPIFERIFIEAVCERSIVFVSVFDNVRIIPSVSAFIKAKLTTGELVEGVDVGMGARLFIINAASHIFTFPSEGMTLIKLSFILYTLIRSIKFEIENKYGEVLGVALGVDLGVDLGVALGVVLGVDLGVALGVDLGDGLGVERGLNT